MENLYLIFLQLSIRNCFGNLYFTSISYLFVHGEEKKSHIAVHISLLSACVCTAEIMEINNYCLASILRVEHKKKEKS